MSHSLYAGAGKSHSKSKGSVHSVRSFSPAQLRDEDWILASKLIVCLILMPSLL